jgi:hypothetical protein
MINLNNILNEILSIYKIDVLIKTNSNYNQVLIYNEVRALPGVVVVTVQQSDFLDSKATNSAEFALLKIKYIVATTPEEEIQKIKTSAFTTNKVDGLLQFIPRIQTIEKVGQY